MDGILLQGVVTIDGDEERAPVGAIIFRPDRGESVSELYLVKLVPKTRKPEYKVEKICPELPDILEPYIGRTIFSKTSHRK
ncbi:MAG: hypothetical protein V1725_01330 [archaeon]